MKTSQWNLDLNCRLTKQVIVSYYLKCKRGVLLFELVSPIVALLFYALAFSMSFNCWLTSVCFSGLEPIISPKFRIPTSPNRFSLPANWNGVQSEGGLGKELGVGGSKHLLPAKPWGDDLLLFERLLFTGDARDPWLGTLWPLKKYQLLHGK